MAIQYSFKNMTSNSCANANACADAFGCPSNRSPDFIIRRHDTKPSFKVSLADCDGAVDVTGLAVEVNMWAKGRLKQTIAPECEYFALADNIGFNQAMVGDIIIMDRVRSPEIMLVVGFDECNHLIRVVRGYRNTTPDKWKKGTALRIFRVLNGTGQTERLYDDETDISGTVTHDVLQKAYLEYEWQASDTCLPGCYWLEFKLIKMFDPPDSIIEVNGESMVSSFEYPANWPSCSYPYPPCPGHEFPAASPFHGPSLYGHTCPHDDDDEDGAVVDETIPLNDLSGVTILPSLADMPASCVEVADSCAMSFTDPNQNFGCMLGDGVEWIQRFPSQCEGYLVKITDTPTNENLV